MIILTYERKLFKIILLIIKIQKFFTCERINQIYSSRILANHSINYSNKFIINLDNQYIQISKSQKDFKKFSVN